jgi:hypothetical protein
MFVPTGSACDFFFRARRFAGVRSAFHSLMTVSIAKRGQRTLVLRACRN